MSDTETGHPEDRDERSATAAEGEDSARTDREAPPASEAYGYPTSKLEAASPLRLDSDRDLSRVGFGALGLSGVMVVCGILFLLAGGILPGALVVGVGLVCALIGAVFLALVAHHQG
jgi:hypothetical protein